MRLAWRPLLLPLVLAILGFASIAGCGSEKDQGAAGPTQNDTSNTAGEPVTKADLEGRDFTTGRVVGHDLVAGTVIELGFEQGSVAVHAGCNRIFGSYRIKESKLVAKQLGSTMMACQQDLMDQDRWITKLLTSEPSIELHGNELILKGTAPPVTLALKEATPE